jgi:transcriptional regulator with GAF, ATPase, and Fis domain
VEAQGTALLMSRDRIRGRRHQSARHQRRTLAVTPITGVVPVDEPELARAVHSQLARLAREMHGQRSGDVDVDELLLDVTNAAIQLLPDVHHAGVTLIDNKRKTLASTAATGPVPRMLDKMQEQYEQGPCCSAILQHHTVRVDDYESETRWTDFTTTAVNQTSVRSSLSIQLYTNESELGALNLYSERPYCFTAHTEELALAIAAHAAIGLSSARRGENFNSALVSRDIIGQAKGMIMLRYDTDAVTAFNMLVKLSQEQNTHLAEIAQRLVRRATSNPE